MSEKTPNQPWDWREARRLRAWELKQLGWKPIDIATALGVSNGAVSQWLRLANAQGMDALRSRKGGGPHKRLSDVQLGQLPTLLSQGAEHFGFRGDIWTRARVGQVIHDWFGVSYSLAHIGRLLKQIGWSRQKAVERASQRDEVAIARWQSESWPQLEKKPATRPAR